MTATAPSTALPAGSHGADHEPSRFAAYAAGRDPAPVGNVERVLALIERMLVPGLREPASPSFSPGTARPTS